MKKDKQLMWITGISLFLAAILVILFIYIQSGTNFEYEGVEFKKIKEGNVIFYHTSFILYKEGRTLNYNVYLRTNPDELAKIPFDNSQFFVVDPIALNVKESSFQCDGDGVIAIGNMHQIFKAIGINIIADSESQCDVDSNYSYLEIIPGETTRIEQTGPSCYRLTVKDCEILPGTERFILEALKIIKN